MTDKSRKKIATDVKVFAARYFDKQRPFEVIDSRTVTRPMFPNEIAIKIRQPGSSAWDRCTESRILKSTCLGVYESKPLFIMGTDFRIGIYYGDVYMIPEKNYYLFEVVREPQKTISLDIHGAPTTDIRLIIESPGRIFSSIVISRANSIEGDIELITKKIKSLQSTMQNLKTLISPEDIETYVRKFYALEKIDSMGGRSSRLIIKTKEKPKPGVILGSRR